MSQSLIDKGQTMAKQQRSVQLPAEIYEFCEKMEERTGLKFNRLVLAAILSFFFEVKHAIDHDWIAAAISLEKGKISLPEVPRYKHEEYAKGTRNKIESLKVHKVPQQMISILTTLADNAENDSKIWDAHISSRGGTIEALVSTILEDMLEYDEIRCRELPPVD